MRGALLVVAAAWGCSSPDVGAVDEIPPATTCHAAESRLEDGRCLAAGVQPDGCPAGERAVGGACVPAGIQDGGCPAGEVPRDDGGCDLPGIPEGACAIGFESDGERGCRAVLPANACPPGLIAVPGDTSCREIMSCGSGTWGDIPVDSTTQYVDKSYAGLDSDGTADKPWTDIHNAIGAATPSAIVAVAAGEYNDYVVITGKPVRLWGRCPSMVKLTGSAANGAAVFVWSDADGTEVRGVSITSKSRGLIVSGSTALVDSVWIHHTRDAGVLVTNTGGTADADISNALIEHADWIGIVVAGARATVEGTAVRDSDEAWDVPGSGYGFASFFNAVPGALTMRRSLIERSNALGGIVEDAFATLEGVVVRDTLRSDGIAIFADAFQRPTQLEMTGSIVDGNRGTGIAGLGANVTLATTVVRGTFGEEVGSSGHGVEAIEWQDKRANLTMRSSLVDSNRDAGIVVIAADADIEGTIIRRTQAGTTAPPDVATGLGLIASDDTTTGAAANLALRWSQVEDNHAIGIGILGSSASIEGTRVTRTKESPKQLKPGGGIHVSYGTQRSDVTVRRCALDENDDYGMGVFGSDAIIEATAFRDNIPAWNDEVGRGLEIEDWPEAGERASVTIRTSAFERHHFAALSAFSAELTIEGTLIRDTAGRGLGISSDPFTLLPSTAVVRWCSLERNQIAGTIIVGSHAEFQGTRIVDTAPHPDTGVHGDGLVALYDFVQQPQIELVGSSIERSARAGIASFAGFVRVESSSLECNAIAMNGQNLGEVSFEFEDGSGNSCGCGQARDQCKVLSQSLEPPEPLDPGS